MKSKSSKNLKVKIGTGKDIIAKTFNFLNYMVCTFKANYKLDKLTLKVGISLSARCEQISFKLQISGLIFDIQWYDIYKTH